MKKTKDKLKTVLPPAVVFIYFFAWTQLHISEAACGSIAATLAGIGASGLFFCVLLRMFDTQKTVSRFLILAEGAALAELVLFFVTLRCSVPGNYGCMIGFLFKTLKLVCILYFYRDYLGERIIPIWLLLAVSIGCDAVSFFYPHLTHWSMLVMAVLTVGTYFRMSALKQKGKVLFVTAHLLIFGSTVCSFVSGMRLFDTAAVVCVFVSNALVWTLWDIVYLNDIVKLRNEEVRHAEKKLDRKTEEMSVMLSQIKPHFIYNTLNTIQYLCRTDGELAADTISDFSDYLRTNLNFDSNRQIVPFSEELEHVNKYLKIEKLRFRHRLMVKYDVREENFLVPTLSLQPIVENSVKHGISKRLNGGTITISTYKDEKFYVIEIRDNGVGFTEKERLAKEKSSKRKSLGLKNIQNRIENLLEGRMEIVSLKDRGTTTTILFPVEKNEEMMQNENSIY